jgi:ethanolamine utilization protein EutN
MFLARIDGTLTSTVKHETLEGCRFLIGQRLDADGGAIGDPLVLVDTLGAGRGTTVLVTTDNETLRNRVGKTTPARMVVCGLVDEPLQIHRTPVQPLPDGRGSVPVPSRDRQGAVLNRGATSHSRSVGRNSK